MFKTLLHFDKVPQLAKTDVSYATGDPLLRPFYKYAPRPETFDDIINDKKRSVFPRAALVEVLREQYAPLPEHAKATANIESLAGEQTFTVATAHQPSLFLGPLYFLYKALTTINLAETVEKRAGKRIVPVFVLGSEDHDLEELNAVNLFHKKLVWHSEEKGAVGSMSTAGLTPVLAELKTILGESDAAKALYAKVERIYSANATIADATQAMLHELFGPFGLVVLNMNDARLKRFFIPVIKAELLEKPSFRIVEETTARLNELGFKTQATPREINLFYMMPGLRERIVVAPPGSPGGGEKAPLRASRGEAEGVTRSTSGKGEQSSRNSIREEAGGATPSPPPGGPGGAFQVLNTDLVFSREEIIAEVENHPERFSPNVVLRPLYQEMILPNLAYVGGGGELAYWLERLPLFEHFGVSFPALIRRNSVLWLDRDAAKKLHKFGFSASAFFDDTDHLLRIFIEKNAAAEMSLTQEINDLHIIFDRLAAKATAIDPTLEKAVRAEEVKAAGSLEQWQSRLVRAEKQKHEVTINQIRSLKEKLFPANGLQERHDNFMPYLLKYGDTFVEALKANLEPFDKGFVILEEGN